MKCAWKVTFAGFLDASFSQSENQRSGAEERKAGGKGRASECQALHRGWGGPASASVQTLWLSDYQKTGTRSLGPEMVLCKKRYCEAPFFYKYLSHSLSLSHPHSLSSSVAHVDGAPLRGLGTDPETVWCTSQGHFSDYSGCVNLSTGAPVTEMEPADMLKVTSNAAVFQLSQILGKSAEDCKYQSNTRQTARLGSSACRSERALWCARVPEGAGAVDAVFYLAGVCAFKAAGIPMMRWWMTFTLLPHTLLKKKEKQGKEMKCDRNTGIIMRAATINHLSIIKSFVSYLDNWFELFFVFRSLWYQFLKASIFRFLYLTVNWIWIFGLWTFDILYTDQHFPPFSDTL